MSSALCNYYHKPLSDASTHVRLLRLAEPGGNSNVIHLEFESFKLTDAPPYLALSYTWGTEKPTFLVSVNDSRTPNASLVIRENLYDFLCSASTTPINITQQFTDPGGPLETDWLWIDQLCINQADHDERSAQVYLMGEIYSRAEATLIWLCPAFPGSHELLNYVRLYAPKSDPNESLSASPSGLAQYNLSTRHGLHALRRSLRAAGIDVDTVAQVLSQRYWTRLWINQEITLAQNVALRIGETTCGFDAFCDVIGTVAEVLRGWRETADPRQRFKSSMRTINDKGSLSYRGPGRWADVVRLMHGGGCEDERDRVYALLALVRPEHRPVPDYTAPADQVCQDLLRRLCRERFDEWNVCERVSPGKGPQIHLHGRHGLPFLSDDLWDWGLALGLVRKRQETSMVRHLFTFWSNNFRFLPKVVSSRFEERPGLEALPGGFLYAIAEDEYQAWKPVAHQRLSENWTLRT